MDYPTMIEGKLVASAEDHRALISSFRELAASRRQRAERMMREAEEAERTADGLRDALEVP